ncbi:MAG: hypothetical protein ACO1TE_27095 [Prosthecobacter sp.]
MNVIPVYYYEPETDWTDRVRSVAQDLVLTAMNWLAELSPWDCLDGLRWWLEGELTGLFQAWWERSPEQLMMAVNGEMPLHCIGEWERSHIIDFDELTWYCHDCYEICQTWGAEDDLCPCCAGTLSQADQGMVDYCAQKRAELDALEARQDEEKENANPWEEHWACNQLLLTERRAA